MSTSDLSVELEVLLGAAALLAVERGRDLASRELIEDLLRDPLGSPNARTISEIVASGEGGIEPQLMVALAAARLLASSEGHQTNVADLLRALEGERADVEAMIPIIREKVSRIATQSVVLATSGCFDGICDIIAEFIVRHLSRIDTAGSLDDLVSEGVASATHGLDGVDSTAPIEKKRKAVVMAVGSKLLYPDSSR